MRIQALSMLLLPGPAAPAEDRLRSEIVEQVVDRCRRQASATAATLMSGTKIPLASWFHGMFLVTQGGRTGTAEEVCRTLGISYNAAWRMRRKLRCLMDNAKRPLELVKGETG